MSVSSPCEICQRGDVEHTCSRCGRLVCDRHFERTVGLCVECSEETGSDGRERVPGEGPDGVDTYRF